MATHLTGYEPRPNLPLKEQSIPVYDHNDGEYKEMKYTVLRPGLKLQFRSKKRMTNELIEDRPMWLDYSASTGKPSFLHQTGNLNGRIASLMISRFGFWINTMVVKKPITILHFPVDYTQPNSDDSYISFYEGVIRNLCVDYQYRICANGYTLDFAFKKGADQPPFRGAESVPGLREICIFHPKEFLDLETSEYLAYGENGNAEPRD